MASPISTGGFHVQAQPGISYLPPAAFSSGASAILPNISKGAELVSQLSQISDDFRGAPLRLRLQEIQVQEAQNRLLQAPVEAQLQQIKLAEAQQNAALPSIIPGDITIEDTTKTYPAALDELGLSTGEADVVPGDLIQIHNDRAVGAGGVITDAPRRMTIKTAEQRALEAEKNAAMLEATRALAAQRQQGKTYETEALIQGYNEALQSGDADTAKLYKGLIDRKTMAPGILPTGTQFGREMEKAGARVGLTMEQTNNLAQNPHGTSAIAKLAQQQAVLKSGRSFIPPALRLTSDEQPAIDGSMPAGETGAPESQAPVVAPVPFQSADQVKAAFKAGALTRAQAENILSEQFGFVR